MTVIAAPVRPAAPEGGGRLPWGSVLLGSVAVTLLRPASWAVGLLGFLAGGGLLLVAWPIVVLPTPTGLQNLLAGPIVSLVFGSVPDALRLLIAGGLAGAALLVVGGVLAGAWAERQGMALVLEAADDDGLGRPVPDLAGAPGTGRIAVLRLLALVPVAAALGLAWQPLYDATYHELVLPGDLAVPLPLRVIGAVPVPVAGVAAAWLLADAAAAIGVRRLVLERRAVAAAWLLGWADLVRRPHRVLPVAVAGLLALGLPLAATMAAASMGWERVRELLVAEADPVVALGATLTWVAIWLGGLVLAGVGTAIRAAAWTLELPWAEPGAAIGARDGAAG